MLTLRKINAALAQKGYKAELVKGQGYFYFISEMIPVHVSPSVMVYRLNQLSLEQWLWEFEQKCEQKSPDMVSIGAN